MRPFWDGIVFNIETTMYMTRSRSPGWKLDSFRVISYTEISSVRGMSDLRFKSRRARQRWRQSTGNLRRARQSLRQRNVYSTTTRCFRRTKLNVESAAIAVTIIDGIMKMTAVVRLIFNGCCRI